MIERIDTSRADAEQQAIATLALAFVQDPVMRWMYPTASEYLEHFPGFCRAFGGPAFACDGAWQGSEGGGAALWLRPGTQPDGEAIERHLDATLPAARMEVGGGVLEKMEQYHPTEPHWYLAIIGVDAAHQGKGLGAKLLQAALGECDAEHLPAYLESSNPANISLYERHGFEVVGEIRIGDFPLVTPMLRPAR
jgi:GNAT superfamily N-acetyltransferase